MSFSNAFFDSNTFYNNHSFSQSQITQSRECLFFSYFNASLIDNAACKTATLEAVAPEIGFSIP